MTRAWLLLGCLALSCAGHCGTATADHEAPRDDDPVPLEPAESADADTLGTARCAPKVPIPTPVQLIGNAVPNESALLVSTVMAQPPALSVLALPAGTRTDLRLDPADAPAAVLAADGAQVVAAYFGPSTKKEQTAIVSIVAAPPTEVFRVSRAPDESLALDVALRGDVPYLVWHEDGELTVRSQRSRIVLPSPAHAVVESPRLLVHGGKLLAVAIARQWEADAGTQTGPQSQWEGAGEPRSTSWLVGWTLDDHEAGPPTQLTSVRGHVDAFDLAHPSGMAGEVVIFAHDATVTDPRGGGSLLRLRWTGSGDPIRATFRSADVGSGPIALAGTTLSYGTQSGDAILVQLGPELVDSGRASREPTMDDARILGTRPGRGLLLAGPADLAWMACEESR